MGAQALQSFMMRAEPANARERKLSGGSASELTGADEEPPTPTTPVSPSGSQSRTGSGPGRTESKDGLLSQSIELTQTDETRMIKAGMSGALGMKDGEVVKKAFSVRTRSRSASPRKPDTIGSSMDGNEGLPDDIPSREVGAPTHPCSPTQSRQDDHTVSVSFSLPASY